MMAIISIAAIIIVAISIALPVKKCCGVQRVNFIRVQWKLPIVDLRIMVLSP